MLFDSSRTRNATQQQHEHASGECPSKPTTAGAAVAAAAGPPPPAAADSAQGSVANASCSISDCLAAATGGLRTGSRDSNTATQGSPAPYSAVASGPYPPYASDAAAAGVNADAIGPASDYGSALGSRLESEYASAASGSQQPSEYVSAASAISQSLSEFPFAGSGTHRRGSSFGYASAGSGVALSRASAERASLGSGFQSMVRSEERMLFASGSMALAGSSHAAAAAAAAAAAKHRRSSSVGRARSSGSKGSGLVATPLVAAAPACSGNKRSSKLSAILDASAAAAPLVALSSPSIGKHKIPAPAAAAILAASRSTLPPGMAVGTTAAALCEGNEAVVTSVQSHATPMSAPLVPSVTRGQRADEKPGCRSREASDDGSNYSDGTLLPPPGVFTRTTLASCSGPNDQS